MLRAALALAVEHRSTRLFETANFRFRSEAPNFASHISAANKQPLSIGAVANARNKFILALDERIARGRVVRVEANAAPVTADRENAIEARRRRDARKNRFLAGLAAR